MLTPVETEQYSRHIRLPGFGLEKQLRLQSARVLIVGAGGLGCPIGLYLAASGVGTIGVMDADRVERSNLQRQIAHSTERIGQLKVNSLIESMKALNPLISYHAHALHLDETNISPIIHQYDLIIDGTDNFATRFLLADACYLSRIPLLHGAIYEYQGQLSLFVPGHDACYRCIFREPPSRNALAPCAEIGVLGIIPGMVGLLMATEAIKFLTGLGTSLQGKLLIYHALEQTMKTIVLSRDKTCPLCGENPSILQVRQTARPSCSISLYEISREEAQILLSQGAFLLDVREGYEFQMGHLPQAHHLPGKAINQQTVQALLPVDQPILVYCQKGHRSQNAVLQLKTLGYENCYSIAGGLSAYQEAPLQRNCSIDN